MASLSDSKEKLDDGVKTASESPKPLKTQEVLKQFEERISKNDVQIAELQKKFENLQIGITSDKNQSTRRAPKNSKENNLRPPTGKLAHHDVGLTRSASSFSSPDSQRNSAATTTIYRRGQGDAKEFCKEEILRFSNDDSCKERVNRIETLAHAFEKKFKIVTAVDVKIREKYDLKSIAEVVAKIWYLTEKYYRGFGTEFDKKEVLIYLANFNITQFMMFPFFYNLYYNSIVPKLTADVKVEANKEDYFRKLSNIKKKILIGDLI